MTKKQTFAALGIVVLMGTGGCASKAGNVALGAGAAGAAYEYSNERQLDELKKERQQGKISQEEHDRRAEDIKDRSLIQ
jgi:membrane-bound lytic murein transglycosylase B